jgi:molybdenum cofactor guanylyltransferase
MGSVLAVVLAGGLARRMGGGDKPLRMLGGRPLLDHVLARVGPQVAGVILNANGDPGRFAAYGLPVVADPLPEHPGPLAGVLAGLDWAAGRPGVTDVLSVPGDCPFLPDDLLARLEAARRAAGLPMACAASSRRLRSGRSRCAASCGRRCWPGSGRSTAGRRASAARAPNGRRRRSIPSSTPMRRRTWQRRSGSCPRALADP